MELVNIIAIVLGALCLLPFSFYFSFALLFGFLYGGILGLINYELIVFSISAPLAKGIGKRLVLFKLIRYALIGGSFALAIFFPAYLNIFAMLAGILLHKAIIVLYELVISKRIGVKA